MRLVRLAALFGLILAPAVAPSSGAQAEPAAKSPVVIELFTSQGCNTCPPADALLGRLIEEDHVIGLSLNVDYWNYLGWRDRFSKPEHTARQRAYQRSFMAANIYTPQMVVQGAQGVVGSRERVVRAAIDGQAKTRLPAEVTLTREADALRIEVTARDEIARPAEIWLFGYSGPHSEPIGAGENRGATITYFNVARSMTRLAEWDGQRPMSLSVGVDPSLKGYALLVQQLNVGQVLGAAKLELSPKS